jgi:hypothetical protein
MNSLVTPKNSPSKIKVGSVWPSNSCGVFKVLECISYRKVLIEFIATGYQVFAEAGDIKRGQVKDRLFLSVCGVGFLGVGQHKPKVDGKATKEYETWRNMLKRCYCPKTLSKHPTYVGCSVDARWHDYQVFAEFFELNYIDGYQLDKDKIVEGNKVYGPESCVFISHAENSALANSKEFAFLSPSGALHTGSNIAEFARVQGLHQAHLTAVKNGKRKHHKGWTAHIQEVAEGWQE